MRYQYWLKILYGPIIHVVVFFMDTYKANRERMKKLLNHGSTTSLLQNAALIILVIWVLIFILASDQSRDRLTQEIQENMKALKYFNQD